MTAKRRADAKGGTRAGKLKLGTEKVTDLTVRNGKQVKGGATTCDFCSPRSAFKNVK